MGEGSNGGRKRDMKERRYMKKARPSGVKMTRGLYQCTTVEYDQKKKVGIWVERQEVGYLALTSR